MAAARDLIEILTWCRGAGTKSEEQFVQLHIATLPGATRDAFGNYHVLVGGSNPQVLWSCHTDTVTHKEGRQNVTWVSKGVLGLQNAKPGMCLGGDDGGGVWLCMEMIKNNIPGLYIFHREEEIGGNGSSFIAKNSHLIPKTIMYAIAMDRAGTGDVISHQGWSRCCSDDFAESLAQSLGDGWKPDDTGVFTDTANYTQIIPECTNLSIGYEHNHGPREILDFKHLLRLRDSLFKLDVNSLPVSRDPSEPDDYAGYYSLRGGNQSWMYESYPALTIVKEEPDMTAMVSECPGVAARLLEELGIEPAEFRAHCFAFTGRLIN